MRELCVTGGTGLIASHLIKSLLLKGYFVRATVRDPENVTKVGFLREMEGATERLKLYEADLTVDGSFDEAILGVDGVFHVACPVLSPCPADDVQTSIIDPSVRGTSNVLSSCLKSTTLKRIVLTSSCYAITQRSDAHLISPFNESHWSDLEHCKLNNLWYAYGKTLAEKTAWKISEANGLDLVVVHPSFVIGPLLNQLPSSTLKFVLDLIKGVHGGYQDRYVRFVHVEDVVAVHILAMEDTKAEGRLICSSGLAHWSEIIDMLRAKYPMYPYETKPINQNRDQNMYTMDTDKVYAIACGFDERRYTTKKWQDGSVKSKLIVCNREGFARSKKVVKTNVSEEDGGGHVRRRTKVTRIGCRARIRLFMKNSLLLIDLFHEGHNHELISGKDRQFQKRSRNLSKYHKDIIVYNSRVHLLYCSHEVVFLTCNIVGPC
ncbi:hypothetical protein RND81_02G187700 [Saponaria officinalis]|uniref:NAD-dependent epimerase/dehydratase domain-containing protein n=1 Tax=Saponaria officinalis TaxID=3572 RepID=A0AAW1MRG9_SAPOF